MGGGVIFQSTPGLNPISNPGLRSAPSWPNQLSYCHPGIKVLPDPKNIKTPEVSDNKFMLDIFILHLIFYFFGDPGSLNKRHG